MEYFTEKAFSFIQKFPVETGLITLSTLVFIGAFIVTSNSKEFDGSVVTMAGSGRENTVNVTIHVAGAVRKPGIYTLKEGSRLNDAIEKAGGLADNANRLVIGQQINLAQLLQDQEKVYIPNISEEVALSDLTDETVENNSLVSVNGDSESELEKLPGIGPITASKIYNSRPYKALEELYTKGVISKKLYDKIEKLIRL